jgi:hypothetical protein
MMRGDFANTNTAIGLPANPRATTQLDQNWRAAASEQINLAQKKAAKQKPAAVLMPRDYYFS